MILGFIPFNYRSNLVHIIYDLVRQTLVAQENSENQKDNLEDFIAEILHELIRPLQQNAYQVKAMEKIDTLLLNQQTRANHDYVLRQKRVGFL